MTQRKSHGGTYDGSPYSAGNASPYASDRSASPYDDRRALSSYETYEGQGSPANPYSRAAQSGVGYSRHAADPASYDRESFEPREPQDAAAGGRPSSPYARQNSPYAARPQEGGRSHRGRQRAAQQGGRVYGEGLGHAYSSSRQHADGGREGGAMGVRPVSRDEYVPGGNPLGGGKDPAVTRRHVLIAGACALAGVAALGIGGGAWWANRAVACEVDGKEAEMKIGSTADDIIAAGLASPKSGNLISIADADGNTKVLTEGGGNPYTIKVNGQDADPKTYRLSSGDKVEFSDGTDVTEDSDKQETKTPCGVQIPPDTDLLSVIGYVKQWGRDGVKTIETGKVSGITVDRGITTEPQDLIIAHNGVNPADGRRLIALTFDDGPSLQFTPQYLDILAQYGAKATFFNLGLNLEEGADYVALCKRCVDEGHQVSSHTYSHDDKTLSGMDEATRANEISKTFQLIQSATGVATQVMRPPYGEFRGWQYLQYIASHGDISYSAYWSVDSLDWERKGVDSIIAACTKNINADNYNGAVVLMHDGGGDRSEDVAALPTIIQTYQSYGYQLVTLNELLKSDPTFPEWVWNGTVTRPADTVIPDISAYVH